DAIFRFESRWRAEHLLGDAHHASCLGLTSDEAASRSRNTRLCAASASARVAGSVWVGSSSSTRRTIADLVEPRATSATWRAQARVPSVSVMRRGGGLGASETDVTQPGSVSAAWLGNSEQTWPSGPKPKITTSMAGGSPNPRTSTAEYSWTALDRK